MPESRVTRREAAGLIQKEKKPKIYILSVPEVPISSPPVIATPN